MKKYILIIPALILCLISTSCGGDQAAEQSRISLPAQAAKTEDTETILTVDGREVPAWRYLYWLAYTCDRLRTQYREAGEELDWNAPVAGGTLADYAREQSLADTALYATVENWAEQYGITPKDGSDPGGMPEVGLLPEQMAELEGVGVLYGGLYELFSQEESALAPEPSALRRFAESEGWLTAARISIPGGEDRQAAAERAAELFARINGAADQAAEFAALADGTVTLKQGDGTLPASLEAAAAALEPGQISGILETEEGFWIFRRLETETEAVREMYFDHLLQTAAECAAVQVTELYETLNVPKFYQMLEALRAEESD